MTTVPPVTTEEPLHRISLVIPVYRGADTLPVVVAELAPLAKIQRSPDGHRFQVTELLLVHDCGPDRSDRCLESMAADYDFVRPIWLSRNFGQHAATLAGMASAIGDWVVTLDEDGQQNPADIARLLDAAVAGALQLVYASPSNAPPHGWLRNMASRTAKALVGTLLVIVRSASSTASVWSMANSHAPWRLTAGMAFTSTWASTGSPAGWVTALSCCGRSSIVPRPTPT